MKCLFFTCLIFKQNDGDYVPIKEQKMKMKGLTCEFLFFHSCKLKLFLKLAQAESRKMCDVNCCFEKI